MYLARILDRILALILVCRFPVNQNIIDDDSYLSDLLFFIDCNYATKKNAFCIMQALCQITPTGKLTDSYDKNEFKKWLVTYGL